MATIFEIINKVPMATLHLICGLPGSGKTTFARKLEVELHALRLSPDEWMKPLFGENMDGLRLDAARAPVENVQWDIAAKVLTLGVDVILENGFWSRQERDEFRARAQGLGVKVKLHFLDVPRDELWERLKKRNEAMPEGALRVEERQLDLFLSWFQAPGQEELK